MATRAPCSRAKTPARVLLTVPAAALLGISCATTSLPAPALSNQPARLQPQPSSGGQLTGARSQFHQSCGPACAAPVNASTGELIAPAATRAGQVLKKAVQLTEAVQGINTLERALSGAELDLVEATLKACVAQVHADINEAYQQSDGGFRFENGKFPNDSECKKIVGFTELGEKVTLARELGRLKHAAAFACLKARLPPDLRENFTVEPRYKPDPEENGVALAGGGIGTLNPDFVVHGTRNATDVQCVYELKFPCFSAHKLDPRRSSWAAAQLKAYQDLSHRCPAAIISPAGLFQHGIP